MNTEQTDAQGGVATERRDSERVTTDRSVAFSDYQATGPLREGQSVDLSSGGVRIVTRYPEPVGAKLQMELRTVAGMHTGVALREGEVIHVTELDDGESVMGVRFLERGPGGTLRASGSNAVPEFEMNEVGVAEDFGSQEPKSAGTEASKVSFRRIEESAGAKRRVGWLPWLIIIALVILLGFLIALATRDEPARQLSRGPGLEMSGEAIAEEEPRTSLATSRVGRGRGRTAGLASAVTWLGVEGAQVSPEVLLGEAQATLESEGPEAAKKLFRFMDEHPSADPIHRFLSLIGRAESAALEGKSAVARVMVRRGLDLKAELPDAWVAIAEEMDRGLRIGDLASAVKPMDEILQVHEGSGVDSADKPDLWLDVDTENYVLNVMRGGKAVKSFAVGLGRNGNTPLGTFTVANKISDPAWYNRGEVVPGGSANNPLGASWMGLGTDGEATSYGIHPTSNPRSVGQPMSRGCVRMRPEDAEALFRMAPIGTPVVVR